MLLLYPPGRAASATWKTITVLKVEPSSWNA